MYILTTWQISRVSMLYKMLVFKIVEILFFNIYKSKFGYLIETLRLIEKRKVVICPNKAEVLSR